MAKKKKRKKKYPKGEDPCGKMPPPLPRPDDAPRGRRSKGRKPVRAEVPEPKPAEKKRTEKKRAEQKAPTAEPRPPPKPRDPIEPKIEGEEFRSGYVAIVGRPNVGKSTLLNALLGRKIAATTHKPQTTRKNIIGLLNPEGAQIVLLDTPGYHKAKGGLNKFMVEQARAAIQDADLVVYLVEARSDDRITPGNAALVDEIKRSERPTLILANKIDEIANKNSMLVMFEAYSNALGEQLVGIVPVSALKRDGLEEAVKAIGAALPAGPAYFEEGQLTDQTERQIVGEMIREKVMLETRDELPYSAAVRVEEFEDGRPGGIVRIHALIAVERDSQKGIVIGQGGQRLKSIGQRARKDIEFFLDARVYLDLAVRVESDWTASRKGMAQFGYSEEGPEELE